MTDRGLMPLWGVAGLLVAVGVSYLVLIPMVGPPAPGCAASGVLQLSQGPGVASDPDVSSTWATWTLETAQDGGDVRAYHLGSSQQVTVAGGPADQRDAEVGDSVVAWQEDPGPDQVPRVMVRSLPDGEPWQLATAGWATPVDLWGETLLLQETTGLSLHHLGDASSTQVTDVNTSRASLWQDQVAFVAAEPGTGNETLYVHDAVTGETRALVTVNATVSQPDLDASRLVVSLLDHDGSTGPEAYQLELPGGGGNATLAPLPTIAPAGGERHTPRLSGHAVAYLGGDRAVHLQSSASPAQERLLDRGQAAGELALRGEALVWTSWVPGDADTTSRVVKLACLDSLEGPLDGLRATLVGHAGVPGEP